MQLPKKIRSIHLLVAGHLVALGLLASTCDLIRKEQKLSGVIHYSGREFAGSQACESCHAAIAATHFETPHAQTSRVAAPENVKGRFDSGANILALDAHLKILMEQRDGHLFQVAMVGDRRSAERPFDITIGSGQKGQTFLYWDSASLFQLPASWYASGNQWCPSPGYPPDQIVFNRNIDARCLECHSTFFRLGRSVAGNETFVKDQVMLGIDCERCHGPAADHVRFHEKYPGQKTARYVVNPASLTRQQRLDNCALCHSGIRANVMPSFTFTVGDRLDDFSYPTYSRDSASALDVHGNQYGLLTSSACFQKSEMDCSSCHDVHARESGQLERFSQRCMSCHGPTTENFCTQSPVAALDLTKNCIDCHMPALPSATLFLQLPDSSRSTPFLIRTHNIAIYRRQVEAFLKKMQDGNDM